MIDRIDAVMPESGSEVSLADRPVAYAVISELLRRQEGVAPRSAIGRVFGARPVHADVQPWFSGAHGELKVGALLARLGPEWLVLHAVPVGTRGSDIDHVLVGPAGVYTINTKHHPGKKIWVGEHMLKVSGQKTDHLRSSRHEAKRAAKFLSAASGLVVEVHPVLAIVDAGPFTFKQRPSDVSIMDARALSRWLNHRTRALSPEAVQRIAAAAVNSRTWHPSADLSIDPTYLARFRALEKQDVQARWRRLLWGAAFAIVIVVVAVASVGPAMTVVFPAIWSALINAVIPN